MIIPSHYKGKNVAVLGLGKSGKATVDALSHAGAVVYIWDDKKELCQELASTYPAGNVIFDEQLISPSCIASLDLVIPSPGVPFEHPEPHPFLQAARSAHIPIKSDLDILYETCPHATYIGITGTNGKSTTTALMGHIAKKYGLSASVGGNLGTAMLALSPQGKDGFFILELSSYQLEITQNIPINIAALLNITPDHLERHKDMQGYSATKKRIFEHAEHAVVVCDDPYTQDIASLIKCPRITHVYYQKDLVAENLKTEDLTTKNLRTENLKISAPNEEKRIKKILYKSGHIFDQNMPECDIKTDLFSCQDHLLSFQFNHLKGQHNSQNIAVCFAIAQILNISPESFLEYTLSFKGLPHRCQYVKEYQNVMIINDSKATNAESTTKALESFDNIYLIAGGLPKGTEYDEFIPYLAKIKKAFLIGEGAEDLMRFFNKHNIPCVNNHTLENATKEALQEATNMSSKQSPYTLLLSPACASFDQFKSFEERGDVFIKLISDFIQEHSI